MRVVDFIVAGPHSSGLGTAGSLVLGYPDDGFFVPRVTVAGETVAEEVRRRALQDLQQGRANDQLRDDWVVNSSIRPDINRISHFWGAQSGAGEWRVNATVLLKKPDPEPEPRYLIERHSGDEWDEWSPVAESETLDGVILFLSGEDDHRKYRVTFDLGEICS